MQELRHARRLVLLLLAAVLLTPVAARPQEKPGPGANLLDLLRERAELKNGILTLEDSAAASGPANTPLTRKLMLLRLNRQLKAKDEEIVELYRERRHLTSGNIKDDLGDVADGDGRRLEDELKDIAEEVARELKNVSDRVEQLHGEAAGLAAATGDAAVAEERRPAAPFTC